MDVKKKKLKWPWIVLIVLGSCLIVYILFALLYSYVFSDSSHSNDADYTMYKLKNISGYDFLDEYTDKNGYLCKINGQTDADSVTVPAEYKGKPVVAVASDIRPNSTLATLVIEEGVMYVENCCGSYSALSTVKFPSTLKAVYGESFKRCGALQNAIFGDTALHIDKGAFSECQKLLSVVLPKGSDVEVGAFSNNTAIQIGSGGVYLYSSKAYDSASLVGLAKKYAGADLPKDKRLSDSELKKIADIWNGPLLAADKIADCYINDYNENKLPDNLEFNVTEVYDINNDYPDTVYTQAKEDAVLNGNGPVVFCICEKTGYADGPEYTFVKSMGSYLGYRFSFRDAVSGELICWYDCTVGYAPSRVNTGDNVSYVENVGNEEMYFFLDENGKRPTPLGTIEQLVFGH